MMDSEIRIAGYSVSMFCSTSAFADLNSFARLPAARALRYGAISDRMTRPTRIRQMGRVTDMTNKLDSFAAATAGAKTLLGVLTTRTKYLAPKTGCLKADGISKQ